MTLAPSRILHLPSGTLSVGAPADVIVFDPEEPWVCDPAQMRGRSKNTPFDEAKMVGRVKTTNVGGRTVFGG
jgi:dihydroorotase